MPRLTVWMLPRWLRAPARSRAGRWILLIAGVAVVVGIALAIQQALQPRVYYISGLSLKYLQRSDKVPPEVLQRIEPILGEQFVEKSALLDAIHAKVGDPDWARYQSAVASRLRTHACWPNTSTRKVYGVKDSRGHPLYRRFGIEVVVPQALLPAVATQLEFVPGGGGVLVLGKFGHLTWFGADWRRRLAIQIPGVYEGGDDIGALGLAVDPDFAHNRFVYVGYVSTNGLDNVIQRLTLSADGEAVIRSLATILRLAKDQTQHVHGMGSLHFLSNGMLLAQVGDPGEANEVWFDYEGTILGLYPGHGPQGSYHVPPRTLTDRAMELLQFTSSLTRARGLRSPFTGAMWGDRLMIGDVGSSGPYSFEEVNFFDGKWADYGWDECEDAHLHADYTPPSIYYRRNDPGVTVDDPDAPDTTARSVIVGVVYDGASQDRYQGTLNRRLIYGDFYLGFVRGAKLNDRGEVEDDVFLMHLANMTSMRIGPDGFVYGVTAFGDKGLFRLLLKQPPQR